MSELYLINENYDYLPELIFEDGEMTPFLVQGIRITASKPLKYKSYELPSSCAKNFYDLDALYVSNEIGKYLDECDIDGLHIQPIVVSFSDGVSLPYYRVDSDLEYDIIDYENSNIKYIDDDGATFESLTFSEQKIRSIKSGHKKLFKIKGLHVIQYAVSDDLKNNLEKLDIKAIFCMDKDYKGV